MEKNRIFFLNGNALKLLALISMTVDHIGYHLYPSLEILRIIGRISFPIFAYMIAEGCYYTRNKEKHLGMIWGVALICQVVMSIANGNLEMCVLVTLALSVTMIYFIDKAIEKRGWIPILIALLTSLVIVFIPTVLPAVLKEQGFVIDFGIFGVLLPVAVRYAKSRPLKLIACTVCIILLCLTTTLPTRWYHLLALIPLALYNGERGKLRLKYLFYAYYPVHIVVIIAIKSLLS
ncbi:MAG: hypothetical protein J6B34_01790 [Clostridia bacterium]|nr:hypothetical protein [Clostridia bacterium]